MDRQITSQLKADLFLLHAPSVYDFRERDDILFAYLSDSVNVTSVYEMYPVGWFSIRQRLAGHGFDAKIVNVASLMLMHPDLDVGRLLRRLEAPVFGFDLHWMTQCQGAVELAAPLKEERPDALTIFGGIPATYYASKLITYPGVNVVVQGYDTLDPVTELVARVRRGSRDFASIPDLLHKAGDEVQATGFTHNPAANYKRFAYRNIMGVRKTLIQKDDGLIIDELRTMKEAAQRTSICGKRNGRCCSTARCRPRCGTRCARTTARSSPIPATRSFP